MIITEPITRALARFVATTPADDIPARVRQQALVTMADTAAVATAGTVEPVSGVARDALLPWAADRNSTVVGDSRRVDPPTAALLNGIAAHALDYDAISFAVSGFVGSATACALTALAEDQADGVPGRDVVTAYCLGWEAAAAIARAINPLHYAMGWHPTSTMSGFAATLACCRLLGLDTDQTAMAMGIAVADASGVKTMIGNMANPFHVGKAARNGAVAARLAAGGFVAHPAAIEAEQGFLNLFNGPGHYRAERIVPSLGAPWDLAEPVFKVHPCCGLIHSGLDAVLDLCREHDVAAADVRRVRVRVHEYVTRVMHVQRPASGYQAKFSVPYTIAAALRDGRVSLAAFTIADPELVELGERVEVVVHPDLHGGDTFFEKEFTEVDLETSRGTWSRRVQRMNNRGSGGIEPDDLRVKVDDCLRHASAPPAGVDVERILAADDDRRWSLW